MSTPVKKFWVIIAFNPDENVWSTVSDERQPYYSIDEAVKFSTLFSNTNPTLNIIVVEAVKNTHFQKSPVIVEDIV